MATITSTAESFEETATANDVVLIDSGASWCAPCRTFAPIHDLVSERDPGLVFAKVDTEANQDPAATFNIVSILTLMIIREGVVLHAEARSTRAGPG